jgi:tetratricopeptide (TPR) repeat protein
MFIGKLRGAATCAVFFVGLSGAAYAGDLGTFLFGMGTAGYEATERGDYAAADRDFSADYRNYPNDSLAQFNMADTYRQRGDNAQADTLYRQVAADGRNDSPPYLIEAHNSHTTVADLACRHLNEDRQSDSDCPAI